MLVESEDNFGNNFLAEKKLMPSARIHFTNKIALISPSME